MIDSPNREFAALLAEPDDRLDLARAALLLATDEYPDLDVDGYLARLDELAAEVRLLGDPGDDAAAIVQA